MKKENTALRGGTRKAINTFAAILWVIFLFFIVASCSNSEPNWLKGNMHTHTFWSDGDDFPENVVNWYKENGYDFLTLTDHNVIMEGERWRNFPDDHAALRKYIDKHGEEWVEIDTLHTEEGMRRVRLRTFEELRQKYEVPDEFLLILGNEISNPHAVHLLAFHQDTLIPAVQGEIHERERMIRETVENLKKYREESGRNVHPVLAHPNFRWAITAEMMINVPELRFFEVYNGHPLVNNEGDGYRASTERIWDIVLTSRLLNGETNILYGLATDDAHHYHGGKTGPGKGWIMVRSDELAPEAILEAIDQGDFYASTGILLKDIQINNNSMMIEIIPEEGVEYETEFIGTSKSTDFSGQPATDSEGKEIENTTQSYDAEIGKVLTSSTSLTPSYQFTGDELYVRARITSSANHIDPNTGDILGKQRAWVQPHTQ